MSEQFFPPPFIDPDRLDESPILERLNVYDGLAIDAKRWQSAHQYHRKRQNLIYQSLNQPGIVYGLGVRSIQAPKDIIEEFSQIPWVEIQPGIAIDWQGNPIIVPKPETMPLDLPRLSQPMTVYLVISHRDPDQLEYTGDREMLTESFRLDLFLNPPCQGELELCRFTWETRGHITRLNAPNDVFAPQANELDLRYRMLAHSRSIQEIRVGILTNRESYHKSFQYLQKSAPFLAPELKINLEYFNHPNSLAPDPDDVEELTTRIAALHLSYGFHRDRREIQNGNIDEIEKLAIKIVSLDLLYCLDNELKNIKEEGIEAIRAYLKIGGILLIETSDKGWGIEKQITNFLDKPRSKFMKKELKSWQTLDLDHPLRLQPFLFSLLPEFCKDVKYADGILMIDGNLSNYWGLTKNLDLPRHSIRTAQEFGLNILHFAWQRRRLTQLCGASQKLPQDK
jgi:hypothetical protein